MSRHSPGREGGFTLMELLVATLVLAVLSIMAYRGLTAVQESERHLARVAGRWQDISRVVDRLGRDIRQATERPGFDGRSRLPAFLGRRDVRPEAGGGVEPAQLAFSRGGSDGQDTRRVGYRWRDGVLELLLWPLPEAAGRPPQIYTLLGGLKSFDLAYLDERGQWRDSWPQPGSPVRPRAVRVNLVFDEGVGVERLFDLP
jgi:general secretion pathway protein J